MRGVWTSSAPHSLSPMSPRIKWAGRVARSTRMLPRIPHTLPTLECLILGVRIFRRIFFSALAQGLQAAAATGKTDVVTQEAWAQALASALRNLYTYTRARPPSRTLVDPLAAFVDTLSSNPSKRRFSFMSTMPPLFLPSSTDHACAFIAPGCAAPPPLAHVSVSNLT